MPNEQRICWRLTYRMVIFLSFAFLASSDAIEKTQSCSKGLFGLNYTLPMFLECTEKQHPNGSMVQTIPKLIPASKAYNRCTRRNDKLGVPPGHRVCTFPECDKKLCENGWCEETMESYICHCSTGFQGEHCNEQVENNDSAAVITDAMGTNTIAQADITQATTATVAENPRDCSEIQTGGVNISGVYPIYPDGDVDSFFVYCDMETDWGGWTVFQRREDGSVDFFLYWSDYKYGFGSVSSEHWLGNDNIHRLSTQKTYELRVDLEDFEGQTRYATYNNFRIEDEAAKYNLTLGTYSGDAGDSMTRRSSNRPFSTRDHDNDLAVRRNCAARYTGAWWYDNCHYSNLNGLYLNGTTTSAEFGKGVVWYDWRGHYYSLKNTEMKIRPA